MRSLLRLKPYLYPYRWLIVLSSLLAFPLAAIYAAPTKALELFVDELFIRKDAGKLLIFPAFIICLFLLNFIIRFLHYYLLRVVIIRVNQRIKNDLFAHVAGLSSDYFTDRSTGTLISRVGYDPNVIDSGIGAIGTLMREPLKLFALLGYCIYINWQLTLITLVVIPALAWVFSMSGRNLKRYMSRMAEEQARLYNLVQEAFTGIRIIKLFRLEKYVRKKFRERSEAFAAFHLKTARLEEAAHPLVELVTAFAIAGAIYFGGKQILSGSMTPGQLTSFFAAFALMINPLRTLNDVNMRLNQAAAACERVFEMFDWVSKQRSPELPKPVPRSFSKITIENLSFAYPDRPEHPVLQGIDFEISQGQVVAIVGESGSGKSSLVSLFPRIFDPTAGSIRIDGIDTREFSLEELRNLIAVVSQDVFLFNDTIEENIRCGKLSASHQEIVEAARRANALEFIEASPDGFATLIGERGQKLSGGQRQRLSIARAFLREAPLLILDEATSSLDTASERAVQDALEQLMKNRTTLVIAHRLTTIQGADRILVMKDGKIIEAGNHSELLANADEYARLHRLN